MTGGFSKRGIVTEFDFSGGSTTLPFAAAADVDPAKELLAAGAIRFGDTAGAGDGFGLGVVEAGGDGFGVAAGVTVVCAPASVITKTSKPKTKKYLNLAAMT